MKIILRAVSPPFYAAKTQARSQDSPYGKCGWKFGIEIGFPPETLDFRIIVFLQSLHTQNFVLLALPLYV